MLFMAIERQAFTRGRSPQPTYMITRASKRRENTILFFSVFFFSLTFYSFSFDPLGENGEGTLLKLAMIMSPIVLATINFLFNNGEATAIRTVGIMRANWIMLLIPSYGLLSSFWSYSPSESLIRASSFLIATVSLLSLRVNLLTTENSTEWNRKVELVILAFALSIVFSLGYPSLKPGAFPIDDPLWRDGRLGGWVIPTNTLGAFSAALLGVVVLRMMFERKNSLNVLFFCFFLATWYATFSRGALLSAALSVAVVSIFAFMLGRVSVKMLMAFICLLVVVLALWVTSSGSVDIVSLLTRDDQTAADIYSGTNRTMIWGEILSKITPLSFFFGAGFAIASPEGAIRYGALITNHAHNGYIQVLSGLGIVIFAFTLAMVLDLFTSNLKRWDSSSDGYYGVYFAAFFIFSNFSEASMGFQIYPQLAMLILFCGKPYRMRKFIKARSPRSLHGIGG